MERIPLQYYFTFLKNNSYSGVGFLNLNPLAPEKGRIFGELYWLICANYKFWKSVNLNLYRCRCSKLYRSSSLLIC